jgi:hypothetical protein
MKRIFTFFLFLLFNYASVDAQYYMIDDSKAKSNPGGLNKDNEYPSGGGLPTGWTSVLTYGAIPKWSTNKTIPFAFKFNGVTSTSYKVSNSGVLTFDVASTKIPDFERVTLPSETVPNRSVCILGLGGIGTNDIVFSKTFGTAPNRQHWLFFTSYGYGGTTISDGTNYCYWSIVLEETTNNIYIVDQRSNGYENANFVSLGVQIDSANAIVVPGSPEYASTVGFDASPANNAYFSFIPGTQPKYDISMLSISTSQYQVAGDVTVTSVFRNLGSETITDLEFNYVSDLGTPVAQNVTGLNIEPFATTTLSHNVPLNLATGTHLLEAFMDRLNKVNVDSRPNNDRASKSIFVMAKFEQRLPLFEIFSSSTCTPCTGANANYKSITDLKDRTTYVDIKYQQDFPGTGDPYRTTESVSRRGYYAINSIPRTEINGGWDGNGNSFTETLFDDAAKIPAFYTLGGNYTYNESDKSFKANVRFSPLFDDPGSKLYVAILEHVTYFNAKSNGETEFHNVMKKMLPTEAGTVLTKRGVLAVDSLSFSYKFNGQYRLPSDGAAGNIINLATEHSVEDFNNLYVIAWIQGNDKQVYQAANLVKSTTVGIKDNFASFENVEVFPNPSSDNIKISVNVKESNTILSTIVDGSGNIVRSKSSKLGAGQNTIEYNIKDLPQGSYNIMLFDEKSNSSVQGFVKI